MCLGYFLKMGREGVVYSRTAQGSNQRQCLRRKLLRRHDAEARCDLRDETHENGRTLRDNPRSAMKRAASVNDFASAPRTAKYPFPNGSPSPTRAPNANTWSDAKAVSGLSISSP